MDSFFAEIILPLGGLNHYTYKVPKSYVETLCIGQRVSVPFGRKRSIGIVYKIHQNPPEKYQAKILDPINDPFPLLEKHTLDFWKFISEHYLCELGVIMTAAVDTNLKLKSISYYSLNEYEKEHNFDDEIIAFISENNAVSELEIEKQFKNGEEYKKKLQFLVKKGELIREEKMYSDYKEKKISLCFFS